MKQLNGIKDELYAREKVDKKGKKYISNYPETTDFEKFSIEEIQKRQELYKNEKSRKQLRLTHIAMDTHKVFQVDIDCEDYQDGYKDLMTETPYNKSSSKSYGRHIFITDKDFVPTVPKDIFKNNKDVELLCGLWSWAPAGGIVYNADKPILEMNGLQNFVNGKVGKKINEKPIKNKPKLTDRNDTPKPIINPTNIKNQDDLEKACKSIQNKETDKILEFLNALPSKYYDEFNLWLQTGWALKCENEGYFILWILFSSKSEKFVFCDVAGYFDKWCNEFLTYEEANARYEKGGLTFASIADWVKTENPDKFNELCDKYKMKTNGVKELVLSNPAEYDVALHFQETFPDKVIFSNGTIRVYNGVFYEQDNKAHSKLSNLISTEYAQLFKDEEKPISNQLNKLVKLQVLDDDKEEDPKIRILKNQLDTISTLSNNLRRTTYKKNLITEICNVCVNEYVKWETQTHLFAFNNKIYDLHKNEWVEPDPKQYITITTGYDWVEPTEEQIEETRNLIKKILPDDQVRSYYLKLMTTGLYGNTLQKFIIALGEGRNGKGCLNDFVGCLMGNYGYILNSSVLQTAIKDGVNQDIANMEYMRFVIAREPGGKGVNNATVRQLTGGSDISARGAYQTSTSRKICLTLLMETNDWLDFNSKVETADVDRLINIPFDSYFTKDPEEVDEKKHIYMGNDKYTTRKFREQYKYALFKILLEHNKEVVENDNNIFQYEPECVKELTSQYLTQADKYLKWTNDRLIKLTADEIDKVDKPYITMKELYECLKNDTFYHQLSKKDKRKDANYKGFCNYLKKSYLYKRHYCERKEIEGQNLRNFIYGFKYVEPSFDDEDEYKYDDCCMLDPVE